MTLNEYQEQAMSTCTKSSDNISYMFYNLVAEMGEFAGKISKAIRKEEFEINKNRLTLTDDPISPNEFANIWEDLALEAGDMLWQLSGLCYVLGLPLEEVAEMNLEKLANRKKNNTIIGDGDHR